MQSVLLLFYLGTVATVTALAVPQSSSPSPSPSPISSPVVTPAPTLKCDYDYCDGATSWCFYWAGITSFDVTRGPVPGETRTSVGLCNTTAPPAEVTNGAVV